MGWGQTEEKWAKYVQNTKQNTTYSILINVDHNYHDLLSTKLDYMYIPYYMCFSVSCPISWLDVFVSSSRARISGMIQKTHVIRYNYARAAINVNTIWPSLVPRAPSAWLHVSG